MPSTRDSAPLPSAIGRTTDPGIEPESDAEADAEQEKPAPPTLHALLVGIDRWDPPFTPTGTAIRPLRGCREDAISLARFLLQGPPAASPESVRLLLSPPHAEGTVAGVDGLPDGVAVGRATRDHILESIQDLLETVRQGDQVLLHVSSHGSRVSTVVPAKREQGLHFDECVLPSDVGAEGSGYLRDVEIGEILERLEAAGALVTLTMDCCHGGGTVRGDDLETSIRLVREDDTLSPTGPASPVPTSPLGSWEELGRRWARRAGLEPETPGGAVARQGKAESGWMEVPERTSFLAACTAYQKAGEIDVGNGRVVGAFTHQLLQVLAEVSGELTYRRVHDHLLVHLTRILPDQTPVLEGVTDRVFLGVELWPLRPSILVRRVDGGRVHLDAGLIHGLRHGARLVHSPSSQERLASSPGTAGHRTPELQARHLMEIVEVTAVRSVAQLIDPVRSGTSIRPADRVELLDLGVESTVAGVRLLVSEPPAVSHAKSRTDFENSRTMDLLSPTLASTDLATALEDQGLGWVELISEESIRSDEKQAVDGSGNPGVPSSPRPLFQVALGWPPAGGKDAPAWRLLDAAGRALPMAGGAVPADAPGALAEVARRLVHLARFRLVQELRNPETSSVLKQALGLEMEALRRDWQEGDPVSGVTFVSNDRIEPGQRVVFRLTNRDRLPLHVAMLDLQPDWSIIQLWPRGIDSYRLEPGETRPVRIRFTLPLVDGQDTDLDRLVDHLKIFATREATKFRWLELSPIVGTVAGASERIERGDPGSALERLFDRLAFESPDELMRDGNLDPPAADEWWVEEVLVRYRRAALDGSSP